MHRSAVMGVAASVVLLGGCGLSDLIDDEPMIIEVFADPRSPRLEVSVNTCNQNPIVLMDESATRIVVTVEADEVEGSGRNDCRDGVEATLAQPLGDREIIDAATGEAVDVLPLEDDETAS